MADHVQLVNTEELFRGAMRAASIGMCLVAPDGSFLEVNPALCELLGREEALLLTTTWQELTHPEDLETDTALVQAVLDGKRDTYRLSKRYLRPDGEVVWGHLAVCCERDSEGAVRYFVSQINDVTRRVEAEQKLARAEQQYRLVAENAASFVLLVGADDTITWLSQSAVRLSGFASESELIAGGLDYVHPDDRWKVTAAATAVRSGSDVVTQDVRLRHRTGTYSWWSVTTRPTSDERGGELVLSFLDIDSEMRARRALKESEERYRWLVDNMQDTLVATDHTGRITFASPSIVTLLGWGAHELVGVPVLEITHKDDREKALNHVTALSDARTGPIALRIVRSDGEFTWVEVHGHTTKDDKGTVNGSISVWHDASQSIAHELELRRLAESDPLTGLPNRRELRTRLAAMLTQRRHSEQTAVLFCDVDRLKQINDRHGHDAGDRLLRTVADRIRKAVRTDDLVARLGGDELVVALSRVADATAAAVAAEKIRAEVSSAVTLVDGTTVTPSVSIGVVLARPDESVSSVLERADDAMYHAKADGGNKVISGQ
ncbi:MAG: PAS domain S-box protein [Actinobacteria bacterium]|nr:MAG: PAS domain S-box protein [Actinomycetota bacterium]